MTCHVNKKRAKKILGKFIFYVNKIKSYKSNLNRDSERDRYPKNGTRKEEVTFIKIT